MQQIIKFHNSILLRNKVSLYYFIPNENSIGITTKLLLKVIPKECCQTYITQWITLLIEINWDYFFWKQQLVCYFFESHICIWNVKLLTVAISSSPLESMLGGSSASRAGWTPRGSSTFSTIPLPCVLLPKREPRVKFQFLPYSYVTLRIKLFDVSSSGGS